MNIKNLLFLFILTLLSTLTMAGCSEDNNQSKEEGTKSAAHGHSH